MQNSFQIENPNPSFLETSRRDSWWIGPFFTAIGLLAFVVYSTWAAFQNEHYQWESYLSPFYAPLLEYDWWPFHRHFWSSGLQPDFGSPDSITERPTTGSSFWHHRPARWEEDLRITVVNGFCFCSRICTAIYFTSLLSFALFSATMSFSRSLLKMASA